MYRLKTSNAWKLLLIVCSLRCRTDLSAAVDPRLVRWIQRSLTGRLHACLAQSKPLARTRLKCSGQQAFHRCSLRRLLTSSNLQVSGHGLQRLKVVRMQGIQVQETKSEPTGLQGDRSLLDDRLSNFTSLAETQKGTSVALQNLTKSSEPRRMLFRFKFESPSRLAGILQQKTLALQSLGAEWSGFSACQL